MRYDRGDSGWTYIEMMITVGIVGIIGSVAGVKLANTRDSDVSSAVAQIFLGDLAFAQNLAMSTNKGVVMTFSSGCDDGEYDRHHGRGRGHDDDHGGGNNDHDNDDGDGDHNHGHGNDDDHNDDDNPGNGNNGNGNGNNGNGHGNDDGDDDDHGNNGNGHGQGQDDDDDHDNGYGNDNNGNHGHRCHGRGHGRGYGHHHDCDDGCDNTSGGYVLTFADGSPLPYPVAASMTTVSAPVTLTPEIVNFRFDSVGRFIVPGYQWESGQTSLILMTINNKVAIQVTRETGKTKVINL